MHESWKLWRVVRILKGVMCWGVNAGSGVKHNSVPHPVMLSVNATVCAPPSSSFSVFIFLFFAKKKSSWLIPEEGQTCHCCSCCCWYQLQKQKLALATSLNASLSHYMWIKSIYHYYIWSSSSSDSSSSRALGVYFLSSSSIICSDHTSSLRHKKHNNI